MEVGEALRRAQRSLAPMSDSAASDARLLLADSLQTTPTWILAHDRSVLPNAAARAFEARVGRCAAGEPLPYVLGWWEFYGRKFAVNPDVLIPRPETELLVERALQELKSRDGMARVVDIGTGSGCVAVTLALEVEASKLFAVDLSRGALRTAQANAQAHGVERGLRFVQADLLEGLAGEWDILCANLPYLPSAEIGTLAVAHREPVIALDGGDGGTALTRRLIRSLERCLAPGGLALLEIDNGHGPGLSTFVQNTITAGVVEVMHDLAGLERLLLIRRGSEYAP